MIPALFLLALVAGQPSTLVLEVDCENRTLPGPCSLAGDGLILASCPNQTLLLDPQALINGTAAELNVTGTAAASTVLASWWYISFRDSLDRLTAIFSDSGDLALDSYQVASLASNATGVTDTRISVLQSTSQGLSIFSALNGSFPGLLLAAVASPGPVWKVDLVGLHRYEVYYTAVGAMNQTLLSKVSVNLWNDTVTTQQSEDFDSACLPQAVQSLELVEGFAVLLCNDLIIYSRNDLSI